MTAKPVTHKFLRVPFSWVLLALLAGAVMGLLVTQVANPVLLAGIVIGAGLVAATLARTEWGLPVLIFISYTNLSDVLVKNHNIPSTAQPFILLLFAAILARWVLYGERPHGWVPTAMLAFAYGLVAAASILWAADAVPAQTAVVEFAKNAAIALVVTMLLQRGEMFRVVIWSLLLSGLFMGALTVFQQLTGTFQNAYGGFALAPFQNIIGEANGHRISGPIGDPNFYGQILLVLVPLALNRFWQERSHVLRLAALATLTVSILAIFFTLSRGAFVGLVIVLAVVLVRRPPKLAVLVMLLTIGLAVLQFLPPNYVERLSTLTQVLPGTGDPLQEVSLRGRLSENTVAWMMFLDHPILGVGLDNYPVLYQDYSRQLGLDPRLQQREPHNLYLEIASQLGLLGLTVFGILIWVMFRGLHQAQIDFRAGGMDDYAEMTVAFGIAVFGYLAASLFLHSAYDRYFWILFGIAMALPQVARNELRAHGLEHPDSWPRAMAGEATWDERQN